MEILKPENYHYATDLWAGLDDHLAVQAVLAQATPGTIFVDDARAPRSGLARVHHRFYLAGRPDNDAFNHALRELFAAQIYPQAAGMGGYTLYYEGDWAQAVERTILAGFDPILDPHEYYCLAVDPVRQPPDPGPLPEGFSLCVVNRALIDDPALGCREDLLEEMASERTDADEFMARSFGLALIHENQVVGWCLSEYNLGERCEVGIATAGPYRRRGLATAMGAAFIAQARAAGVRKIGWHCRASNRASSATALKLGCQKGSDHASYLALYDLTANLALHGDLLLDQGAYAAALEWLVRSLGSGSAPDWAYIDAAAASVSLDDPAAAFGYLNQVVERGFDNRGWLQSSGYLRRLQGLPEWAALLERMGKR